VADDTSGVDEVWRLRERHYWKIAMVVCIVLDFLRVINEERLYSCDVIVIRSS
jgi:hypothetical protein